MAERNEFDVSVEMLLVPEHRGAERAAAAAARLGELGFEVTGVGEVSLTACLSRSKFRRLFGRNPTSLPSGFGFDVWSEPPNLSVPDTLTPWVESLFEARRAQRY